MQRDYSAVVRSISGAEVVNVSLAPGESTDRLDGVSRWAIVIENNGTNENGENWMLQFQVSNDGDNWIMYGAQSVAPGEFAMNDFGVAFRYCRCVAALKDVSETDFPPGSLFHLSICISDSY